MSIIAWIVLGAIAGYLAGFLVKGDEGLGVIGHIVLGIVALIALRAQDVDEVRRIALDADFVDAAGRTFQGIDGSGSRYAALVDDDDVIAGVLDVW